MAPPTLRINLITSLLVSLLLLAPLSSGLVEGFNVEGMDVYPSLRKDVSTRKLLLDVLDYDEAGPNRKHDPKGRLGAGASKNP